MAAKSHGRRSSGRALLLGSLGLLGGLAGCGDDAPPPIDGLAFAVDAPGPFAVGYREFEVTYVPRDGVGTRTIPIAMWYPADPEATAANPTLERPTYLYTESQNAFTNAPPADPAYEGQYPVVVHSHGHVAYENHAYRLGEGLAALGFVFVGPGHIGDRIFDLNTMEDALDDRYERVDDIRETLDALEELPPSDPMAGRFKTDRVVVSGHSRGSFTVWALLGAPIDTAYIDGLCTAGAYDAGGGCPAAQLAAYAQPMSDARIVAGIPMAGSGDSAFFGGHAGLDVVTKPVLMMTASADQVGAMALYDNVPTTPVTWIELAGGCHDLFASGICGPGAIDNTIAQPAIRTYFYAFARKHIFESRDTSADGSAVLDGTREVASIVTFRGP